MVSGPRIAGRTSFQSHELDLLAERMGALRRMNPDSARRWFKVRSLGGSLAGSSKGKVIFDATQFEKLTDAQLLAVAAHELVHIRENHEGYRKWHVFVPSYLVAASLFLLSLASLPDAVPRYIIIPDSALVLLSLVFSSVGWTISLLILVILNRGWRKSAELKCDAIASSFVDGRDLIDALKLQDTFVSLKLKSSLQFRWFSWLNPYPSLKEREEAIHRVMEGQNK